MLQGTLHACVLHSRVAVGMTGKHIFPEKKNVDSRNLQIVIHFVVIASLHNSQYTCTTEGGGDHCTESKSQNLHVHFSIFLLST